MNDSTDEEDDLNLHPPKDKDEEKDREKWRLTQENVWNIIKDLKEG